MNNLHYISYLVVLGAVFSPALVYATSANNIPLMINIHGMNPNPSPLKVNSAEVYLNTTDSHYHVRGTVTNTLHESKDFPSVTGAFTNKTTGHLLSSVFGPIATPIGPGKTVGYDFDTGYTPAQLAQFRSMELEVNAS
jgi:hypothetical protein